MSTGGENAALEFRGTSRFQVLRRLGAGGMGIVYEAFDREQKAKVALKTLRKASPDALLRLKREFRALQDVRHPNLVTLGELIEQDGDWFFTMELIRGASFLEYVTHLQASKLATDDTATDLVTIDSALDPHETRDSLSPPLPVRRVDEPRLRWCLQQLARGLSSLHIAGKVHRDVKPSNILVNEKGHLYLLDFGLITDTDDERHWTGEHVVGTAAYMAPEQAGSQRVGPEADWYSVGVLLYEALTGRLPFTGSNLQVLMDKQQREPVAPAKLVPGIPDDLNELCIGLLHIDPAQRPKASEILRKVGVASHASVMRLTPVPSAIGSVSTGSLFVGRNTELAFLEAAYQDTQRGKGVTVFVEGESGVGKSTLVRAFTDRVEGNDDRAIVLSGRCYERESVPFKAMDAIIDSLARVLQSMKSLDAARVVPQRASLLLQVFPVLRCVEVLADTPRYDIADPQELRTRVFGALRELFCRLADRHPLILVIDDLHWADADSMALLHELLRPPDSPAMLLLASVREVADVNSVRAKLDGLPGDVRHLVVRELGQDSSLELAQALLALRCEKFDAADAAMVAKEAAGHPLFIDELARHMASPDRRTQGGMDLGQVLWTRISQLDDMPKRVLELVAVAGSPVENVTLTRALGTTLSDLNRHVAVLRAASLVRAMGTRTSDRIEPYHDRIRYALTANLSKEAQRLAHHQLARAIEGGEHADPEALAVHYGVAGEPKRAAEYAILAAEAASRALAFDRSARMYRLALDHMEGAARPSEDRVGAIRRCLADELAKASRGAEAARAYMEASVGASPAEVLDLQRRAAQQLLVSGHIDEGLSAMRKVLSSVLKYPATPKRALMGVIGHRARLALRGFRYRARHESEVSERELALIDACWHAGVGLSVTDTVRGAYFQTKGLLLGLAAGEPYRLARLMGVEAGFLGSVGSKKRARTLHLLEVARKLAAESKQPHANAFVLGSSGTAKFLLGEFEEGLAACEAADAQFRERCTGVPWEIATMQLWICRALLHLGRLDEMSRRVSEAIREFQDRENRYGVTSLRVSVVPFVRLAADKPDAALEEVNDALSSWSVAGFHVQHYYSLFSQLSAHLYRGAHEQSQQLLDDRWHPLERSMLMRVQFIRISMLDVRARSAILCALHNRGRQHLTAAERAAAQLDAEKVAWAKGLSLLLRAQVAHLRGQTEHAATLAGDAANAFDASRMELHAVSARQLQGHFVGGDEGTKLRETAETWMRREAIQQPTLFAAMLAPVLHSFSA